MISDKHCIFNYQHHRRFYMATTLKPNKECSAARNVSGCLYLFHPTCEEDDEDDYALLSSDKNGSRLLSIFDYLSEQDSK